MYFKGTQCLKKFLHNIDLFASSQLLRFKTETDYSTLTGGFLSLLIIIIFGALLIQNSISVFSKSSVNGLDLVYYLEDPTFTSFQFGQSDFIIAVGITDLNLSSSQRYFDISLSTQVFSYGNLVNETIHQLQPCQYQQWANVNKIGANSYEKLQLNSFLCPSQNISVELQGKYSSETFKLLRLMIGKCSNSTDPSRPCASEEKIKNLSTYNVNYYFMNAFVNSATLDPVGYYLQDRNYFGFALDSTVVSNIYLTENIISTDSSLLPWDNVENQTILRVDELAQVKNTLNYPDQYLDVYLRKSPYYILSQRSFTKIQDLFSSIGGLFSFALFFLIFMRFYTQASFQIQMGDRLFYYNSQLPLKSGNFNFLYFLAYCFYVLFRHIGIQIPSQRMKIYYQCREEVKEQLDISLLMNKITFLEKCMNVLFQEHQFRAIYLQQKPNVKEAQCVRRNHGLNKIIHKNSKKINDKIQDKVKLHHEKLMKKMKDSGKKYRKSDKSFDDPEMPSIEQNQRHFSESEKKSYDLMQVVTNVIIDAPGRESQKQIEQIQVISQQPPVQSEQDIELQEVAGQSHNSLKFLNTALKDIKQIEEQAKNGNPISQRIYLQLNNDITKQQLIVLKCLQTIIANKPSSDKQDSVKNQDEEGKKKTDQMKSTKKNLFQNLMRLSFKNEESSKEVADVQEAKEGLQIILESNDRIKTENYL